MNYEDAERFDEMAKTLEATERALRRANQQCAELRGENELLRAQLVQYRSGSMVAAAGASA